MHRHLALQPHLQMQKKCTQRQTTTQHIEFKPANLQALVVHMQEVRSAVPWTVTCCGAPLYGAQRPKIVRCNHPTLYPAHPPDSPKLNCKQIHKTNPLIALGSFFLTLSPGYWSQPTIREMQLPAAFLMRVHHHLQQHCCGVIKMGWKHA